MKSNALLKYLLGGLSGLLASVIFLITFVDSRYIPSWKEIFGVYEKVDLQADIISFIDVGQGDCILLQSNGRFALIDTGVDNSSVVRTLKRKGIAGLDALILSHWHSDHCGSANDIINSFEVANAVFPHASPADAEAAENSKQIETLCANKGINLHYATEAMVINLGDIELTVLYCHTETNEENNRSLVIMAQCRGRKVLFTGDIEASAEYAIMDAGINIDCDVLKVAHHGSDTSSVNEFLEKCSPQYAVITVGKNNPYGHPVRKTLNALYGVGAQVYRTDYDGSVNVTFDNTDMIITTEY